MIGIDDNLDLKYNSNSIRQLEKSEYERNKNLANTPANLEFFSSWQDLSAYLGENVALTRHSICIISQVLPKFIGMKSFISGLAHSRCNCFYLASSLQSATSSAASFKRLIKTISKIRPRYSSQEEIFNAPLLEWYGVYLDDMPRIGCIILDLKQGFFGPWKDDRKGLVLLKSSSNELISNFLSLSDIYAACGACGLDQKCEFSHWQFSCPPNLPDYEDRNLELLANETQNAVLTVLKRIPHREISSIDTPELNYFLYSS